MCPSTHVICDAGAFVSFNIQPEDITTMNLVVNLSACHYLTWRVPLKDSLCSQEYVEPQSYEVDQVYNHLFMQKLKGDVSYDSA